MNYKLLTIIFVLTSDISMGIMFYFTNPQTVTQLHNIYTTEQMVTIFLDAMTAFIISLVLAIFSFSVYVTSRSEE